MKRKRPKGMDINQGCYLDFFFSDNYSRDFEKHDFRRMLGSGSMID